MNGPISVPGLEWVVNAVILGAGGGFTFQDGGIRSVWPEADEGQLRELADNWEILESVLRATHGDLNALSVALVNAYGGQAGDELRWSLAELVGEYAGAGGLGDLAYVALERAQVLRMAAGDFAHTKVSINAQALATALSVAPMLMMAWWNPAAAAAVPTTVALGRQTAVQIYHQLRQRGWSMFRGAVRQRARREVTAAALRSGAGGASRGAAVTAAGGTGTRTGGGFVSRMVSQRFSRQRLRQAINQGWTEIVEEALLVDGVSQAYLWLRDGRDWDLQQTALSGLAGWIGGTGSTLAMGGRALRGFQYGPGHGSFLQQLGSRAVVGGARNAISSPLSSYLAQQVVMAGDRDNLPGLRETFVQGVVGGFTVGAIRGGGSLTAQTLGAHYGIAQFNPHTGVVVPRPSTYLAGPQGSDALLELQLQTVQQLVHAGRMEPSLGVPPLGDLTQPVAIEPAAVDASPAAAGGSPGASDSGASVAATAALGRAELSQAQADTLARSVLAGDGALPVTVEHVQVSQGQVHATATIHDVDGAPVGSMTRVFGREADGTTYVTHASTALRRDAVLTEQGDIDPAFAQRRAAFEAGQEAAYRRAGFTEIRLDSTVTPAAVAVEAGFAPPAASEPELGVAPAREVLAAEVERLQGGPAPPVNAQEIAAAEVLLAAAPSTEWQPTVRQLLGLGSLGATVLNTVAPPLVRPVAPASQPAAGAPVAAAHTAQNGSGLTPLGVHAWPDPRLEAGSFRDETPAPAAGGTEPVQISAVIDPIRTPGAGSITAPGRASADDSPPVTLSPGDRAASGEPAPASPAPATGGTGQTGGPGGPHRPAGPPGTPAPGEGDSGGPGDSGPADLVTALYSAGIAADINRALQFGTSTSSARLTGGRGSVAVTSPPQQGELSLRVRPAFGFRSTRLTVVMTSGPEPTAERADGRAVVRLAAGMSVASASEFVTKAVAMTVDEVAAARRWRRSPLDMVYATTHPDLPARGLLREGALPESFLNSPRARRVTALDVVNLEQSVRRPLRVLQDLDANGVDHADPRFQQVLGDVIEGARWLGLTQDSGAPATAIQDAAPMRVYMAGAAVGKIIRIFYPPSKPG